MRTRTIRIAFLALVFPLLLSACDLFGLQPAVDEVAKTNGILTYGINALANQSADWQSILQDTRDKLTDSAQSTIRNEITTSLQRAEQAAATEIKCIIDFLRVRVREDLIRIRAALLKQPVDQPTPFVCSVVPAAIDLSLDPTRRNLITLDGYNFDTVPPIQAFLVNGTQIIDETSNLHRTTHYEMTLNLGTNGIQVSTTSQQVVVRWKDQVLSDIPIIVSIPACKTMPVSFIPSPISVIPLLTRGDADFNGNGPEVILNVYPTYSPYRAGVIVDLSFIETDANHEMVADGCPSSNPSCLYLIYTPPPGWRILSISDSVTTTWDYIHSPSNHVDNWYPGVGYVIHLQFSGFEGSNAAGVTAQGLIEFKELHIQLGQTSGCQ